MTDLFVTPGLSTDGPQVALPTDKSICHRALLMATLAPQACVVRGLNKGRAVTALIDALRQLGVSIDDGPYECRIGQLPATNCGIQTLDFGGSSAAARMFLGVAVGRRIECVLNGNASLRRRPMDWVIQPLIRMGARISYLEQEGVLPVQVRASELRPHRVRMSVASAQARSAVLFAAVAARVPVTIECKLGARDHTERLFAHLGANIEVNDGEIVFDPARLTFPTCLTIPVDPSACAYLVAGHLLMCRPRALRLQGVCLNPGRIGFFSLLQDAGFELSFEEVRSMQGEPVGDIVVPPALHTGRPFNLAGQARLQSMIDEVPLAAAVATRLPGTSVIRDGGELVFKETNRLETTARMLGDFGASVTVEEDGLRVTGGGPILGGEVPSFSDHRIAMSAVTIAATADTPTRIRDGGCAIESFPDFELAMQSIGYRVSTNL